MATSTETIRGWLQRAQQNGATHVIVVCDTFDWSDYPVEVRPDQDVQKVAAENGYKPENGANQLPNGEMQKVMEVYSLSQPIEDQLSLPRAFSF